MPLLRRAPVDVPPGRARDARRPALPRALLKAACSNTRWREHRHSPVLQPRDYAGVPTASTRRDRSLTGVAPARGRRPAPARRRPEGRGHSGDQSSQVTPASRSPWAAWRDGSEVKLGTPRQRGRSPCCFTETRSFRRTGCSSHLACPASGKRRIGAAHLASRPRYRIRLAAAVPRLPPSDSGASGSPLPGALPCVVPR
jgi:hypothetical protein